MTNLTDEDVERITDRLLEKANERFQIGLGKSILSHVGKVIVGVLIAAALWGLSQSVDISITKPPMPH